MTVVMQTDSDKQIHQLWAQDQAASCAVASIWMARNQAMQQTFNEEEWALAWALYRDVVLGIPLALSAYMPAPAPRTFNPSSYESNQDTMGNMFSNWGTYMDQVAQKLRLDGLKATVAKASMVDTTRLSETTPAIILLGWYNGAKRNGGHFIVASRVNSKGQVVYLDPWGGKLVEMGPGPAYDGTGRFESICYISRD